MCEKNFSKEGKKFKGKMPDKTLKFKEFNFKETRFLF